MHYFEILIFIDICIVNRQLSFVSYEDLSLSSTIEVFSVLCRPKPKKMVNRLKKLMMFCLCFFAVVLIHIWHSIYLIKVPGRR